MAMTVLNNSATMMTLGGAQQEHYKCGKIAVEGRDGAEAQQCK